MEDLYDKFGEDKSLICVHIFLKNLILPRLTNQFFKPPQWRLFWEKFALKQSLVTYSQLSVAEIVIFLF